jgi:glutamine amidotransferase-like uncharacterized protein
LRSFLTLKSRLRGRPIALVAFVAFLGLTGCGSPNWSGVSAHQSTTVAPVAGASATTRVLLYNGTGTSSSDVVAVEAILSTLKLTYATANTSQMDSMSESQLKIYKLLIVPGGNSITIGDNLSKTATTNIHNAVVNDGLHYLGICAGAFFGGYSIYNGLDLTSGVWFNFYADENKGIHKEPVLLTYAGGKQLDMYWQDGPQLDGWGEIIAKYPDGTSAMVEGASGKGWVILSGVHPEAPASWRVGMHFTTSVATDLAYAGTLVTAALDGTTLAHY